MTAAVGPPESARSSSRMTRSRSPITRKLTRSRRHRRLPASSRRTVRSQIQPDRRAGVRATGAGVRAARAGSSLVSARPRSGRPDSIGAVGRGAMGARSGVGASGDGADRDVSGPAAVATPGAAGSAPDGRTAKKPPTATIATTTMVAASFDQARRRGPTRYDDGRSTFVPSHTPHWPQKSPEVGFEVPHCQQEATPSVAGEDTSVVSGAAAGLPQPRQTAASEGRGYPHPGHDGREVTARVSPRILGAENAQTCVGRKY